MELSPSEIRYSQDSISNKFTNKTPLTATFARLLAGNLSVSSLPPLECIQKDGNWYVTSGNRRLYLYKHLQNAGLLSRITVSRSYGYNGKRFTTNCSGLNVRCRGHGLESQIQQIISEWKRGEDIVAKWGTSAATPVDFVTYRDLLDDDFDFYDYCDECDPYDSDFEYGYDFDY